MITSEEYQKMTARQNDQRLLNTLKVALASCKSLDVNNRSLRPYQGGWAVLEYLHRTPVPVVKYQGTDLQEAINALMA